MRSIRFAHSPVVGSRPSLLPTLLDALPFQTWHSFPLYLETQKFLKGLVSDMTWDPVYKLVKQIPRGRVLTYGAVAKALRLRGGARSAGRAMAASPSGKGIPWHRVLGANGKLLIREPYASLQKKLLESEGVTVIESRVDLRRHVWSPTREMSRKSQPTKSKRPN